MALIQYVHSCPKVAITSPLNAGPMMAPVFEAIDCSPNALCRSLRRHNVGNQRLPGGAIKGDRDPIHSRDDVDPPDADGAKISEHPQRQGGSQHGGLGDEQHPPAVERIRHQPADQRKQDDRDEPCQPHPADSQRLVGEGTQMPVDRPGLHLGAGNRH